MGNLSFNPMLTTNALGSFGVEWTGGFQGTALADPAVRFQLAGGILATSETLDMYGGIAISENIPSPGVAVPSPTLGGLIKRATTLAQVTGFSVFDQNYAAINTPQSPVPLSAGGQMVNFYRFGTNARIWLNADPALVDLETGLISQQVSWDFNAQQLVPYAAGYNAATPISQTYTSATGILALTFSAAPGPVAGDQVSISGWTPAELNGSWSIASTASAGAVLNLQLPTGLGSLSPTGGQLDAGGGALGIRGVLRMEVGNSMTVDYDPNTGFATWNRSGTAALVLL